MAPTHKHATSAGAGTGTGTDAGTNARSGAGTGTGTDAGTNARSGTDAGNGASPDAGAVEHSAPDVIRAHNAVPHTSTVEHMAQVFSLLGDPGRIRILAALVSGPLKVRDIAAATHQSQSSVSHSLRLLRAHHVVAATRVGREAFYALEDQHVRSLLLLTVAHVEHDGHQH